LSNAVAVIYAEGKLQPEAVITIRSARRGHRRQGFYRIGLLPALLVEDVTVEVRDPETVRDALQATEARLKALGHGSLLELRRIEVRLAGQSDTKLSAKSLLLGSSSVWQLRGDVRLETSMTVFASERAALTVTGRDAGRLDFETDGGKRTFNLFGPNRSKSQPSTRPSP